MSRVGKKPVPIAKGVKVSVNGRTIAFEGPKGKLAIEHHPAATVKVEGGLVMVGRINDEKLSRAVHGLTRALIANNIKGVGEGYAKDLEIQGVGYKAELQGKTVVLSLGFANQLKIGVPDGVAVKIEAQGTKINIQGADKQAVGHLAAEIRKMRKPEPYKGKGVRYLGEVVKKKLGKQFAGAGAK
ncbi:MAG: 50S ribosomal protein L6 [Phycisphaerales bacterium]|nr:50S ribosomal protein L6 [Phycisphaerales bacterium]